MVRGVDDGQNVLSVRVIWERLLVPVTSKPCVEGVNVLVLETVTGVIINPADFCENMVLEERSRIVLALSRRWRIISAALLLALSLSWTSPSRVRGIGPSPAHHDALRQ